MSDLGQQVGEVSVPESTEEFYAREFTVFNPGGSVGVTCNGRGQISALMLEPEALTNDETLAEEIVAPEVIASDPGRVLFPGFMVDAVCQVAAGNHPAPLTGYWRRDNAFFNDYHEASREAEGFARWCDEWVREVADQASYRAKLGQRLEALRIQGQALSAPANWAAE